MKNQNLNLENYNQNDIFWKDFENLPNNPYKLQTNLKDFKSLLVFPTIEQDMSKQYYPVALGYMASLSRMNKSKVKILVQDINNYNSKNFSDYDLISFYPMTALFNQTMEMSKKVKKDYPDSKISFFNSDQHQHEMVLCNPRAQEFGKEMMKRNSSIDFVLIGEAESSFIKLCDKLNKQDSDFRNVPACLYREGEEIKVSEKPIEPINFKFLPFASRDYLEKSIFSGINHQSPRIQSSRGCVSPCLYCVESFSNITKDGRKKPILNRDIHRFIDEIKMLRDEYGVVFFNVIDSSFEDPGKKGIEKMNQFCDEIIERDIEASFKIHLRTETVEKLDDFFLDKLKYAGVDIVIPGVESGLEKELKSYKKITTPEKSARTIKRLENYGKFFSILGHIMFSPILELDDLPKKADYVKKLHHGWDYLNMSNNILIFPGTAYNNFIKKKGLILEHDSLAPIIPYRFEDERVGFVAREMSRLKINQPSVVSLQDLISDSMNIVSRYHNKMNKHLHINNNSFVKFTKNLREIMDETEERYYNYFMDLVNLAGGGYSEKKTEMLHREQIQPFYLNLENRTRQNLEGFLNDCKRKNLPINKLVLKTWMTLLYSKVDTFGGKISQS